MKDYFKYWIKAWFDYLFTNKPTKHKPINTNEYELLKVSSKELARCVKSFGFTTKEAAEVLKSLQK